MIFYSIILLKTRLISNLIFKLGDLKITWLARGKKINPIGYWYGIVPIAPLGLTFLKGTYFSLCCFQFKKKTFVYGLARGSANFSGIFLNFKYV